VIGSFLKKMMSYTGPGTALQEVLYGIIMALIFVYAYRFGILEFPDKPSFMITVLGMDITWGVIDGIIFYYIWDLDSRRQYRIFTNKDGMDRESRVDELVDCFSGTALDILSDKDKREVCDMILDKGVQSPQEYMEDRKTMMKNSLGCVFFGVIGVVPIFLPLFFIDDMMDAMGMSCVFSAVALFIVGYLMGPKIGANRFLTGIVLAGISIVISVISVFTGG